MFRIVSMTTLQRLLVSLQHQQANARISGRSMKRMEDWSDTALGSALCTLILPM